MLGAINDIFFATQFGLTGITDAAPPGVRGLEIERINVITQANGGPAYNNDDNMNSEDLLRVRRDRGLGLSGTVFTRDTE